MPGLRLAGRVFRDSDGDGYLDEDDRFPTEYAAALDRDGDGAADAWTPGCNQNCKTTSKLLLDQLPGNAAAALDTDF